MRALFFTMCLLSLIFNFAKSEDSVYVSKELKFKITPPTIENKSVNSSVAMFYLPQEKGFTPNVHVIIQEFKETMAEYDKMNKEEFAKMKWDIIKSEVKGDLATYEYTGLNNKLKIHCYVRACKIGESVYLITATALDEQWEKVSAALIKSADSFQPTK